MGLQAPRGIGDKHVRVTCPRGACRAWEMTDAGVGGALLLRDHRHLVAFTPGLELFDGGGAEGVARGQHHGAALILEVAGDIADGCGFAGTVDAHHQQHEEA